MPADIAMDSDERVKDEGFFARLMKRPELGAIAGLVLVTTFFLITADHSMFTLSGILNFLSPAAQLGILGIAAAMLMIGGEFDLSIGSMVAFAGMVFGALTVNAGLPLIVAIPLTMLVAALIGAVNGNIVLRTGLPSFIVTLASGMIDRFKSGLPKVPGIPVEILWFIFIALAATWVLLRTPAGNWIFASGGDKNAAANSGVPVRNVKIALFMFTAVAAALVAVVTVLDAGSTDARRGFQKEFEAIIAAVIGGALLTGGYGSAIGAFFGSIIFGMVVIGLTYTDFDQDWFQVFLGAMLLLAVVFNNAIRKRVTGER
ncbi:MAG: ABC transporter permease [Maritimibacter sp.]